jgi:hypothetical protein
MEGVYENAHFTIAASSAQDSSCGLFAVRQALQMVSLPYYATNGEPGQVYAYIQPEFEKALYAAPLSERAWVFQEYFLSRRTVHFTKHGLVWTCNGNGSPDKSTRYMTSELGKPNFDPYLETEWTQLVHSYSKKQLTYKTDKLIAIEGLREQFQTKCPDRTYCHGLWLQDMPHDLLWYSEEKLVRDIPSELGIPSWSWAANTGIIRFKSWLFEDVETLCTHIHLSGAHDEHLIVNSSIKLVDEIRGPMHCQAFRYEDLLDMDFHGRLHDDYKNMAVSPTFLLLSGHEKVGWAVFDSFQASTRPVYCLSLLRDKIPSLFGESKEHLFLWVLVFQRNGGGENEQGGIFERIGWGLVLVPSGLEEQPLQEVILK